MSKQYLQTNSIVRSQPSDVFSLASGSTYLFAASGSSDLQIYKKTSSPDIHDEAPADTYTLHQTLEKAHSLGCHHVCVAAEGHVASSVGYGGDAVVWEIDAEGSWSRRGSIVGEKKVENWAPALSQNGKYLAITTHDGRVNVYDTDTVKDDSTATRIAHFETKGSFGLCIDISPNGEMTASGHQNGSIYIFNNSTGRLAHSLSGLVKPVRSVKFSPANRYLAAAGDAKLIAIYDTSSGEQIANLAGHASWVMSVSWNWSGEYLLSGSYDGKAKIWSIDRRECVATQTESEKCLWSVTWLHKAASARSEMFATAGADRTISFFREASGS